MKKLKSPEVGEPKRGSLDDANRNNRPTKIKRVLAAFAQGQSLTRFEAAISLRDWCLHSTVSAIQKQYGIQIARKTEIIPGYLGSPTRCSRYWLDKANKVKALKVLERMK